MTTQRKAKQLAVALNGLRMANRGNPFWSKADAMRLINQIRNTKEV